MSLAPLLLAERAVPRYTSYPTAPHFSDRVGPQAYGDWLSRLPADAAVSIYLHVPFCHQLCLYCGCHTKAVRRRGPIDAYAVALRKEIATIAAAAGARAVSHLHWGGGTPSILGSDHLIATVDALDHAFDLSGMREHAIELDPRHVTPELVRTLARIGVNRASLGVQDFSPHVQAAIGRIQPPETIRRATHLLQDAGIGAVNFDLMYGLPRQAIADVRRSAEHAIELGARRIALFGYAHVPWFKKQQRLIDAAALPGAVERLEQMRAAHDVLMQAGYDAVGLDHYARPGDPLAKAARAGRLHRNFQGYTTDDATALIGLGASAIGRLPQGYVQNAPDTGAYHRAVNAGVPATMRGIELAPEDRIRAAIIERLMCNLHVDLSAYDVEPPRFEAEIGALAPLAADGLIEIYGTRLRVTERGRPFVRLAAAAFDTYLAAGRAVHSRAV